MENFILQASSYAKDIDNLIMLIAVLGGVWLFAAEFILFYFIFKYRRSANQKAAYITGEKHHEKQWIHWPHYAVIVCDIVIIYFAITVWMDIKQTLPPPDSTIRIVGQQWAWKFTQPGADNVLGTEDDIHTVDELHVQVGKVYHFKLEADDVLHSFSVPVFRLKQDAVPGRTITGWFKPTVSGTYDIQCAEMCGIGHGIMGATLTVSDGPEHQAWIRENTPTKDENFIASKEED